MKVVTEVSFDDILDSNLLDRESEAAQFLGDVETMNRGDELMNILDREFDDYPEMPELVGHIESTVNSLADKMDLIPVSNEFRDDLDNFRKQIEVAKKQSDSDEMFDALESLNDLAEETYYDIYVVNYVGKDVIENFINDGFSEIRDVRSLNSFENENYDILNQVLTNMEQDLDNMNQILR